MTTLTIARRFNGPPNSGNGGYVCGCAARALGGPAEVNLHSPPPLETPLHVVRNDAGLSIRSDQRDIAQAVRTKLDIEAPPAPSLDEAENAARRYRGFLEHGFPGCFVCGPHRAEGDGLRIFTGPLRDGLVAAPWIPGHDLAGADGKVAEEFLWAALDCPTYWGLPRAGALIALLARMRAAIDARPAPGETCIVVGWALGSDGRKHRGGAALYDEQGALLARAEALWIEI